MTREPRDEYMVYVPDGASLPRFVSGRAAVDRALDELGRRAARVRRVTEGELARDLTHTFEIIEPDEYPDEETAGRLFKAERSKHFAFGQRRL